MGAFRGPAGASEVAGLRSQMSLLGLRGFFFLSFATGTQSELRGSDFSSSPGPAVSRGRICWQTEEFGFELGCSSGYPCRGEKGLKISTKAHAGVARAPRELQASRAASQHPSGPAARCGPWQPWDPVRAAGLAKSVCPASPQVSRKS